MGTSSSSDSTSAASGPPSPEASGPYEKWLVRILLTLAFGLAFGIEGMTLIRSFVLDDADGGADAAQTASRRSTLREGAALVPSVAPTVRVRRLRVRATDQAWTFTLVARPDSARTRPVSLSLDRLTTSDGSVLTTAPSHTWAPADTTSLVASWTLPVGQRPDALTVTATVPVGPDSTVSATRTMDVGHVPVRVQ
ncbi:MAG: hypothetical protein ABEL97_14670 [Salinibacter sp.]